MKILVFAPYIYISNHKSASKNRSGLAYMIRGIVDMLSVNNNVYVFTQSNNASLLKVGGWTYLPKTIFQIAFHLKKSYIKDGCHCVPVKYPIRHRIRILYYFFSACLADYYVNKIKPDVIHIHGIGFSTLPFYCVASRFAIPVVSTLHGLNSWSEYTNVTTEHKILERRFISSYLRLGCIFTFVSTGMKKKVEAMMGKSFDNIIVIPNAIDIDQKAMRSTVENKGKVINLICVGGLSQLKNQIQVIRILPLVQKIFEGQRDVFLHIVGGGSMYDYLSGYVEENGIHNVIFHGQLPREQTYTIIASSDILIFPSLDEGFGLPIIEAYCCGVPVVAFSDLNSIQDVYDPKCMVLVNDRSDGSLLSGISYAMNKHWNKDYIITFSSRFSYQAIGSRYDYIMRQAKEPLKCDMGDCFYNSLCNN